MLQLLVLPLQPLQLLVLELDLLLLLLMPLRLLRLLLQLQLLLLLVGLNAAAVAAAAECTVDMKGWVVLGWVGLGCAVKEDGIISAARLEEVAENHLLPHLPFTGHHLLSKGPVWSY